MAIIHNLIARFRADTGAFDRNVKKSRSHMTRFGRDVKRMGKQLLAVAGVGGGIYMLNRGLRSVVRAALEQQKAERDLMAAVRGSITQFKSYAAEIQKLTIYGDEQILTQMAYAKNLGVTTAQLEAATTAAIGLAAKYRLDLATSMMLVGRASQGQTQMLTRYGIVLEESLSDQEKFNAVLKIGAEAFGLAEAEAATAAGSIQQMQNAISDTAETIGDILLPSIGELSRETTNFLQENSAALKRYVSDYIEGVKMISRFTAPGMARNIYKLLTKERKTPIPIAKPQRELSVFEQNVIARGREQMKIMEQAIEVEKGLQELRQIGRKNLIEGLIKEGKKHKRFAENQIRIYTDIARRMAGEWSNAFDSMLFEGKKFGDAMKDMLRGILRMVTQILTYEMIAKPIAAGIMGVPAAELHSGGIVGQTAKTRRVPALAFAGAPRLHGGFAGDEYPAILQRGEQVIPRGGGGGAPTIIINNQSGQKMRQEGQPMFDGRKWVITVVADDIQQGGTLRKMFQGIKK